jgi:hypothetical protein
MNSQHIFPVQALTESLSEPSINMEGQKVTFDKKVSLLPVDIRKEATIKTKVANGKSNAQHTS